MESEENPTEGKLRTRLKIAFGLFIAACLIWLVFVEKENKQGTLKPELSNFKYTDTTSLTRIVLSDKDLRKVVLEKKDGVWLVNGKYPARKDVLQTLFSTLGAVEVKMPVGRSSWNTVVKRLAVRSTKLELYKGNEKVKSYYVGGASSDQMGTYMLIEGSSSPFITHIPGFEGYLTPRYNASEDVWRGTAVFSLAMQDIASVSLEDQNNPQFGFSLQNTNNTLSLSSQAGKPLQGWSESTCREYLARFKNLNYEAIVRDYSKTDSLLASKPFLVFTVTTREGKKIRLDCWHKRNPAPDAFVPGSNIPPWDPDRFYAIVNGNKKELLLLQFFVFEPVLKDLGFFFNKGA